MQQDPFAKEALEQLEHFEGIYPYVALAFARAHLRGAAILAVALPTIRCDQIEKERGAREARWWRAKVDWESKR